MGVAATAESSAQIRVTWIDNSTVESGFRVERSANAGATWSTIATKAANTQLHLDSGLTAATAYRYRVVAFNAIGESAPSGSSNATTWPAAPARPTNLRTIALASTSATVAWDSASPNHGVEIYADAYTGPGQTLTYQGRTEAGATSQLFNPIQPGVTYAVMVRSVYLNGQTVSAASEFSDTFIFTAPAPSGGIRVVNNTVYDIGSFLVNGSEVLSAAIPAGSSREFAYAPGTYRWRAETWWGWTEMYTYGDLNGVPDPGIAGEWVTVGASGYAVVTITNIPATTYMSGGAASATWTGDYYLDNGAPGFARFQFFSGGRYQLFDNGSPLYNSQNLPTYSEMTPRSPGLIRIRLNNTGQTFNVDETAASFQLQNGPPSWPIIWYTRD
ncbi:MAG: fibronectin type III domain-containing protein [Phycisphaerales bacterium]|nr:fibronectin type III domain-containing protein [Phycisphaerales bacterium]